MKEKFDPEAVVCQCGADGLAGDPNESFNLTPLSLGKCVYTLLSWKLPILLLGGGKLTHNLSIFNKYSTCISFVIYHKFYNPHKSNGCFRSLGHSMLKL